ncbi:MAG: hypothetical protein ACR2RV_18440 [Verrucomicrobiales bacterium]
MTGSHHDSYPPEARSRVLIVLCLLAWGSAGCNLIADELPPDASHLPDVEVAENSRSANAGTLPLPSWGDDPAQLTPRLWPGNTGSPSTPTTTFVPEIQLPPKVDPTVIPDLYLTDYFGTLPETYLVDPQTLLTAHERSSINRALKEHFTNHKLPVYILLFEGRQQIPEFQNLEAIQTRWFGDRPGVVIGFWLAAPTRTNAFFGHALQKEYGARVEKAFADALGQSYTKTYPFSQLDHFTYTLLWRLAHLDEDSTGSGEKAELGSQGLSTLPAFPPIDSNSWIPVAATGLSLATGVAAIGVGTILALRKRGRLRRQVKPVILPVAPRAERLGAPHSGGSGAMIRVSHHSPKIPS